MKIFPAIDIKDQKCVRLVKGDFDNKTEYEMSPIEQAGKYKDYGFKNLHIVDLDGALTGETVNLDIIQDIVDYEYIYAGQVSEPSSINARVLVDSNVINGSVINLLANIVFNDNLVLQKSVARRCLRRATSHDLPGSEDPLLRVHLLPRARGKVKLVKDVKLMIGYRPSLLH